MSTTYSTSKNKFVHIALQSTIQLVSEIIGADSVNATLSHGLDIAIVGDNDFYSQRAAVSEHCFLVLSVGHGDRTSLTSTTANVSGPSPHAGLPI